MWQVFLFSLITHIHNQLIAWWEDACVGTHGEHSSFKLLSWSHPSLLRVWTDRRECMSFFVPSRVLEIGECWSGTENGPSLLGCGEVWLLGVKSRLRLQRKKTNLKSNIRDSEKDNVNIKNICIHNPRPNFKYWETQQHKLNLA